VLQWCHCGVTVVLPGVPVVLQWCHSGVDGILLTGHSDTDDVSEHDPAGGGPK
jgi:hypothetical protein